MQKKLRRFAPKKAHLEPFLCQEGNFSESSQFSKLQFSPVLEVILKLVLQVQFWGWSPSFFSYVTEIYESICHIVQNFDDILGVLNKPNLKARLICLISHHPRIKNAINFRHIDLGG